jgi:hypothetical protein
MDGKRTRDNIYCTYVPSSSSGNPCTSNGGVAGSPIYLIVLTLCTTMDRTANDRCILSNRLNLLEVQGDCRPNCSVLRSTTRAIRNVILIYVQNGIYYSTTGQYRTTQYGLESHVVLFAALLTCLHVDE